MSNNNEDCYDSGMVRLSDEVLIDTTEVIFLIKRNGEEVALCESELLSVQILDSLAAKCQKDLVLDEGVLTAFREDMLDENKIIIYAQRAGGFFFDSPVLQEVKFEYLPVHTASVIHQRLSKSEPRIIDPELET